MELLTFHGDICKLRILSYSTEVFTLDMYHDRVFVCLKVCVPTCIQAIVWCRITWES